MGGGGKAPKAPDYTPLFEAAQKSADYAYDLSQQQFDFFKDVYNKNVGTADLVTDKALGEMDKMIDDSDRYRAQQIDIYDPMKRAYAEEAEAYASPERQEAEAGAREADVAMQAEQARQVAQDRLEAYGVDPSQTRSSAMDLASRVNEASAQASAGNAGRKEVEMIGRNMRENAINMGANLPAQITGSSQAGGQMGNQGINTQLATTQSGATTLGTAPQWGQIGNQGLGTWGNLLAQSADANLNTWKANQSSSSGLGSLVGNVLGAATMFLADGGAIPEEEGGGPIPIEASPSGGAITDDVDATITSDDGSQQDAQLNAGEFVMPKRTVAWLGEKGMQAIIAKADKEMGIPEQPKAEPSTSPPPGSQPSFDGAGIPA
jgi:hypothetical protein